LDERKLIAFRELSGGVDLDAANALITQQARIDLELELTARRQEAEAEYLRKHQEAVAATQKYLDDANAQLANALTRANAARLEAETLEAAAISINQQTTESARKKADAIIAAAEAEARSVSSQSNQDLEHQYAQAKTELERLQSERESVEVYLKNLRNVLQTATGGNENPTK
jgi:chromosome segregation ATPase